MRCQRFARWWEDVRTLQREYKRLGRVRQGRVRVVMDERVGIRVYGKPLNAAELIALDESHRAGLPR